MSFEELLDELALLHKLTRPSKEKDTEDGEQQQANLVIKDQDNSFVFCLLPLPKKNPTKVLVSLLALPYEGNENLKTILARRRNGDLIWRSTNMTVKGHNQRFWTVNAICEPIDLADCLQKIEQLQSEATKVYRMPIHG